MFYGKTMKIITLKIVNFDKMLFINNVTHQIVLNKHVCRRLRDVQRGRAWRWDPPVIRKPCGRCPGLWPHSGPRRRALQYRYHH